MAATTATGPLDELTALHEEVGVFAALADMATGPARARMHFLLASATAHRACPRCSDGVRFAARLISRLRRGFRSRSVEDIEDLWGECGRRGQVAVGADHRLDVVEDRDDLLV